MNTGVNIHKLATLFMVFFLVMSGTLFYWQVLVAPQLTGSVYNNRRCLDENAPLRGKIYDRNGVLLAYSKRDPSAHCGYLRVYTEPSLAGLLGYYAGPDFETMGIEKTYDAVLTGRGEHNLLMRLTNNLLHRPLVGENLYLTIDVRIQRLANQHFDDPYFIDGYSSFSSHRGAIVIMNPQTGEVLAMVSRPGYDPNRLVQTLQHGDLSYYQALEKNPEQPLLFRPLWGKYIPGSTYKTLTLMAALDSASTTLQQPWSKKQALGPVYFDNHAIGPEGNNIDYYTRHFPVSTEYAYAHSDNVVFAQLGVNTGKETWLEYNRRFYIGQPLPFDLPTAASTILPEGREMRTVDLAAGAFGQGTNAMTPLQIALIDNAVAAAGRLMRPILLSRVTDQAGNVLENYDPQLLGQPISSETAQQVRQGMYGVIQCGPGLLAHVNMNTSPWSIIGKTGTAQVSNNNTPPAHSWLMTQAPYTIAHPEQLPALTIVALRENGGEAAPVVGPMIASIYNDIFQKKYVQVQQPATPDWQYCAKTGLLQ